MNRVTMINLAGRALSVEDEGVEAIERWMERARRTLAGDPDRDELLSDFEEAIGDRCRAVAPGAGDVVTAMHVEDVLTALGSVEPADVVSSDGVAGEDAGGAEGDGGAGDEDEGAGGADEAEAEVGSGSDAAPLRHRRLYRLTGEGEGMIAGVVAGIASYVNVDVTVVRLVAVIFAVLSFGATLLVYVVLALVLPAADSPDERMALRGYGDSAKEVMSRARANATPALSSVGSTLRASVGVIGAVVTWSLMLALSAVAIGGSVAVAWVFAEPEELATAFDAGTSTWTIAVWVSSGFWLAAGVLIVLVALVRRMLSPRNQVLGAAVGVVGLVMMTVAAVGFVVIPMAASTQVRSLMDGEGQIEIFGEVWCLTPEYGFEEDIEDCDARSSSAVIEGQLVLPEVERRLTLVGEQVAELELRLGERAAELELRLGDGLELRLRR